MIPLVPVRSRGMALSVGSKFVVVKGCEARNVRKGSRGQILDIRPVDSGVQKVVLCLPTAATISFYVRHQNRLADSVVNMNDGNPMHKIQVRAL